MSRGDGRVMHGVLSALEQRVRLNTRVLTAEVFGSSTWGTSDEVSTRRALRRLHAQRRVFCLGFDSYGSRVWCLPEYAGLLRPPWGGKREALEPPEPVILGEQLRSSFAAGMARAWNSQTINLLEKRYG